ncbi:unnamed protein product [Arctogadus glacialis]
MESATEYDRLVVSMGAGSLPSQLHESLHAFSITSGSFPPLGDTALSSEHMKTLKKRPHVCSLMFTA